MSRRALLASDNKLASEVREALGAIGERLLSFRKDAGTSIGGRSGVALAHYVLGPVLDDPRHAVRAQKLLERDIDALANEGLGPALYSGFTGVAWTVELIANNGDGEDDANAAVDEAILGMLAEAPTSDAQYDLINGLVGLGLYAVTRFPRETGKKMLAEVVRWLDATGVRNSEGIGWLSLPEWIPEQFRGGRTQPYYDFGLAHGIAGIFVVLAHAIEGGVETDAAKRLLQGSVSFLLSNRLPEGSVSAFPSMLGPTVPAHPSRAAWCYGDPGIAISLLRAGIVAKEPAWETLALDLARAAAKLDRATAGVVDPGLCHGSAGLAHIYSIMGRTAGDRTLSAAARRWIKDTLAFRTPGRGIAGFWSVAPPDRNKVADPTFLTGVSGIALALASALSGEEPGWDRALGLG